MTARIRKRGGRFASDRADYRRLPVEGAVGDPNKRFFRAGVTIGAIAGFVAGLLLGIML